MDNTKIIISEEKYNHLKMCAKNLERISEILKSPETKKAEDSIKDLMESIYFNNVIIPIFDKSNIFTKIDYTYLGNKF